MPQNGGDEVFAEHGWKHHRLEYGYGKIQRVIADAGFEVDCVFYQCPFFYIPRPEPPPVAWTQGVDPDVTLCVAVNA